MGSQCLHCSVCDGYFESKLTWNRHLLEAPHHQLAQNDCSKHWWLNEKLRECCLVLFSRVPINYSMALDIISELSKPAAIYVTDFSWWRDKPRIAVVQFESGKVAEKVCKASTSNREFRLKKASDYLDLEWEELIPNGQTTESEIERPLTREAAACSSVQQKLLGASVEEPPAVPIITVNLDKKVILKDFTWIADRMNYSKENLAKLTRLMNTVQDTIADHSSQTVILQNHYLGLRYNDPNISVLVYSFSPSRPVVTLYNANITLKKMIHADLAFKLHLIKRRLSGVQQGWENNALLLENKTSTGPSRVNILFTKNILEEGQMCRLIKHLIKFDTRLRPVLTLVTFWAMCQDIRLSLEIPGERVTPHRCPDPLGVHLLVVLFFMSKHLIPSTKELVSRTHLKKVLPGKWGLDVGFSQDETYIQDWLQKNPSPPEESVAWIVSVVQLTHEMFLFYSEGLATGQWLWDLYDGIILTEEDVQRRRESGGIWYVGDSTPKGRIFLSYPFNRLWKMSFAVEMWDNVAIPKMKEAAKLLQNYLVGGEKMNLADCLAGGKVDTSRVKGWLDNCPLESWKIPSSSHRYL